VIRSAASVPAPTVEALSQTLAATRPGQTITVAIIRSQLEGIAKPMPGAGAPFSELAAASVGIPMHCPDRLTSAPPLLPGLIGALIWIAPGRVAPGDSGVAGSPTARPVAETMPSVTLLVSPSGVADGEHDVADLDLTGVREPGRRQACQVTGPDHGQIIGAVAADQARGPGAGSPASWTWKLAACPVAWALVTILPLPSRMTPEPRPPRVRMSTIDGTTWRTTGAWLLIVLAAAPAGAGGLLAAAGPCASAPAVIPVPSSAPDRAATGSRQARRAEFIAGRP
jgi:hypothetical protein